MEEKTAITVFAVVAIVVIVAFTSTAITGAATTQEPSCQKLCASEWVKYIHSSEGPNSVARDRFLGCMEMCKTNQGGGGGNIGVCQPSSAYCDGPVLDLRCSQYYDGQSCTAAGCYWCSGPTNN